MNQGHLLSLAKLLSLLGDLISLFRQYRSLSAVPNAIIGIVWDGFF
ncbi:MAG: hypothetical protein Q7U68_04395 [Candidatus Roizmanbacteria bacterium]|nr:hypothetical protein [Candidatus Roizmanbacteria bacterium]